MVVVVFGVFVVTVKDCDEPSPQVTFTVNVPVEAELKLPRGKDWRAPSTEGLWVPGGVTCKGDWLTVIVAVCVLLDWNPDISLEAATVAVLLTVPPSAFELRLVMCTAI